MGSFEKNCPVCGKKFTSLLGYTKHIGEEHKEMNPSEIVNMGKEKQERLGDRG